MPRTFSAGAVIPTLPKFSAKIECPLMICHEINGVGRPASNRHVMVAVGVL